MRLQDLSKIFFSWQVSGRRREVPSRVKLRQEVGGNFFNSIDKLISAIIIRDTTQYGDCNVLIPADRPEVLSLTAIPLIDVA